MSDALVRAALETRLSAWAAAQRPPLPIAFENVSFTPPATLYLRAFMLRAPTRRLTVEGAGRRRFGVFQISVALPIGGGAAGAEAIAASLDALFPPAGPLLYPATLPTVAVWVTQPLSQAAAVQEPDRYVVPLSFPFECDEI